MDARPRQIADQALALAEAFLAASRDNIAALADGDGRLLYEAGEVLRLSRDGGSRACMPQSTSPMR